MKKGHAGYNESVVHRGETRSGGKRADRAGLTEAAGLIEPKIMREDQSLGTPKNTDPKDEQFENSGFDGKTMEFSKRFNG